jgi:Xaa-Pro aminopeptidase
MNYRLRQQKLMCALGENHLDALVITHGANIRYLCGFTGSAGVLVAKSRRWVLYTDGRYRDQAKEQVQGASVVISKGAALVAAAASLARCRRVPIGIEADHLTVAARSAIAGLFSRRAALCETSGIVERLRAIKEPEEIRRIRNAVAAGSNLFRTAVKAIRPGRSEIAVAAEIEYAARRAGAERMSFDTIVAAGPRSALPHGLASAAAIPRNGFVVMDFGVILAGYCSDMTRTVYVGRPNPAMRAMYEAVREAQLAGIEAVGPGVEAGKVDRAARRVLRAAGLARYFTHSTGHGVGLEVHEPPRVGRAGLDILQPGMVITVEPGVYLPGKAGVRIEDMILVTERGSEVLAPAPKDLIVVGGQ